MCECGGSGYRSIPESVQFFQMGWKYLLDGQLTCWLEVFHYRSVVFVGANLETLRFITVR